MKKLAIQSLLAGCLLSASSVLSMANAGLIFAEDFNSGSNGLTNAVDVSWSDSSGQGFEVYNAGGAGARGMSGTYDHDNNPATAQVPILGAIEVNDDQGNELLTATFTLDSVIASDQMGSLSFFGGVRGNNASGATVEIYNLTQNQTLSGVLTPLLGAGEWVYNSFSFAATSANLGDELQFRWQGGGTNSANGQEITQVNFSVVEVSEPTTLALFALGVFGLGLSRLKKRR
ncbi:PEP-CTERM sorting domain-containing protein [Aliivibrio kagoshimensis]|uniref:PEP-CTERM sorting domain-containing protein n=1 Tax=Aliivibrio kagoshimensis TaxID=2910230 RepID=UPI003D0A70AF